MAIRQANVVYKTSIQTNDEASTTDAVKKTCKVLQSAFEQFSDITKARDPHAEVLGITSKKGRKANRIDVEITFFCMKPSLLRLQKADPCFQGYGRWA